MGLPIVMVKANVSIRVCILGVPIDHHRPEHDTGRRD